MKMVSLGRKRRRSKRTFSYTKKENKQVDGLIEDAQVNKMEKGDR